MDGPLALDGPQGSAEKGRAAWEGARWGRERRLVPERGWRPVWKCRSQGGFVRAEPARGDEGKPSNPASYGAEH